MPYITFIHTITFTNLTKYIAMQFKLIASSLIIKVDTILNLKLMKLF